MEIEKNNLLECKNYAEISKKESISFIQFWKKNELGEDAGKQLLISYVAKCLNSFLNFSKTPHSFDNDGIVYWAQNFVEEKKFLGLKLMDVNNFFKSIYNGKYGKTYGAIDAVTLNLWAEKYKEERLNYVEEKSIEEHRVIIVEEQNKLKVI